MNICCCINEKFIEPFKVLCYSLIESQEEKIEMYLIYDSLSKKELADIRKYLNFLNITFHPVLFPEKIKKELQPLCERINPDQNLSFEIYFRLFLPELLPEVNRILYLDSDIIVQKNISNFYYFEFKNTEAVAILDIINVSDMEVSLRKRLEENLELENNMYVNSGVLLLNLENLRKSKHLSLENIIKVVKEKHIIYHDQDIINVLLKDTLFRLSNFNYNTNIYRVNIKKIFEYPILHYVTSRKPWNLEENDGPLIYLSPYLRRVKLVRLVEDSFLEDENL